MQLRSIVFFHGRLAALALWLGAACFPPFAAAGDMIGPWGEAADRHGFRPFAPRYGVLPHARSAGELSLGSADSGTLRLETEGEEPLPPIVVDDRPEPVQVSSLDPFSYLPDPAGIAREEETIGGDTAETVEPAPPREPPRRRPRARLTRVHVRPPASKQGMKPSGQDREDLTISFAGIDQKARSTKFRYKLIGLNSEWIETDGRSVQYSDLQPGNYRFEVQAANAAGLWSEPARLSVSVQLPSLWRRYPWLAVLLAGAGIASMGSLYSAARARRLLQVERLRASIAANLHDRIGAGLTDIAILSEVAARKTGDLPELSRVAATARELVDGMGDIVWLVNPRRDSLYELFLRLKDAYAELFVHAGAELHVGDLSPFEGARLPMTYRQDLHLLFQEALRNALRHSGCRRAELFVTLHGRDLAVELRDDGRGFDPESRGGEGLETMRRRAERLGGRLHVESSPEGAVVRFVGRIP
jgi:signal transduction histidine kinase